MLRSVLSPLISQYEAAGPSHLHPRLPHLRPALPGRDGGGRRLRRPDRPQLPPHVRRPSVRGGLWWLW